MILYVHMCVWEEWDGISKSSLPEKCGYRMTFHLAGDVGREAAYVKILHFFFCPSPFPPHSPFCASSVLDALGKR